MKRLSLAMVLPLVGCGQPCPTTTFATPQVPAAAPPSTSTPAPAPTPTPQAADLLTGTWQVVGGVDRLELLPNGTALIESANSAPVGVKWVKIDDHRGYIDAGFAGQLSLCVNLTMKVQQGSKKPDYYGKVLKPGDPEMRFDTNYQC